MKKTKKSSVLACVTGQFDCDRIIGLASSLAEIKGVPLHVLAVVKPGNDYSNYSKEFDYLFQVAKSQGADMTILFNENAPKATADFAKKINCKRIVTGMHDGNPKGFIVIFNQLMPKVAITMIDKENSVYNMETVKQSC